MKKYTKNILPIIITILITSYISTYWIQLALIQGDSMLPTFHNFQLVFINKHSNNFGYNDIIFFTNKNLNSTLIKRIIAVPGDTVQIINGTVYVNKIPSPYIIQSTPISYAGTAASPVYLSDDEYFVVGDNLEHSKDSRYSEIGCVKYNQILGKILN